jgi:hypothetical protein
MRYVVVTGFLALAIIWGATFWIVSKRGDTSVNPVESQGRSPAVQPPTTVSTTTTKGESRTDVSLPIQGRSLAGALPASSSAMAVDPFAEGGPTVVIVAPNPSAATPSQPNPEDNDPKAPQN